MMGSHSKQTHVPSKRVHIQTGRKACWVYSTAALYRAHTVSALCSTKHLHTELENNQYNALHIRFVIIMNIINNYYTLL